MTLLNHIPLILKRLHHNPFWTAPEHYVVLAGLRVRNLPAGYQARTSPFCHCEPRRGEAISWHDRKDCFVGQNAPSSRWHCVFVTMFWYRYKLSDLKAGNPGILNVLFQPNSLRSLQLFISLSLISIGHFYYATLGHFHFALTVIYLLRFFLRLHGKLSVEEKK